MLKRGAQEQAGPESAASPLDCGPCSASAGSSPQESGGYMSAAASASACLDQYAPMLPSDPVQHLPLLPAGSSSATVRVAAWLLGADSDPELAARRNDMVGAVQAGAAAGGAGQAASTCPPDSCAGDPGEGDELDRQALLEGLEEEAAGVSAFGWQQPSAVMGAAARGGSVASLKRTPAKKAGSDAGAGRACRAAAEEEGGCRRGSLELFMRQPVQHGDALNNYVASLY